SLGADALDGARAVILAGSAEANAKAVELAASEPVTIIDLSHSTEERPDARLRAPLVEPDDEEEIEVRDAAVHVIAHPAAIALALFLRRLHQNDPIHRSVIQIFAPASEYGAAAVEELQ